MSTIGFELLSTLSHILIVYGAKFSRVTFLIPKINLVCEVSPSLVGQRGYWYSLWTFRPHLPHTLLCTLWQVG